MNGERSRRVVGIPMVVKPVVVPVPLGTVEIQIQYIPIAVRIPQKMYKRRLSHCPLNALGAVSYLVSKIP